MEKYLPQIPNNISDCLCRIVGKEPLDDQFLRVRGTWTKESTVTVDIKTDCPYHARVAEMITEGTGVQAGITFEAIPAIEKT